MGYTNHKAESWQDAIARRLRAIVELEHEGKIRKDIIWYSDYTEEEHELISERMNQIKNYDKSQF